MGLLDDAIREHLELKRRRGADTTEVARQEKEAFGPTVTEAPRAEAPAADPPEAPEAPTRLHVADPPADELEPEIEPPRPHGDPADSFPHAPAAPGRSSSSSTRRSRRRA